MFKHRTKGTQVTVYSQGWAWMIVIELSSLLPSTHCFYRPQILSVLSARRGCCCSLKLSLGRRSHPIVDVDCQFISMVWQE